MTITSSQTAYDIKYTAQSMQRKVLRFASESVAREQLDVIMANAHQVFLDTGETWDPAPYLVEYTVNTTEELLEYSWVPPQDDEEAATVVHDGLLDSNDLL